VREPKVSAVRGLLLTAKWHVRHALPGHSALEATRALVDLERGDLEAASTRNVCPGWRDHVSMAALLDGREPVKKTKGETE